MSVDENGVPVVPRRRKRVPAEEQLDAPELTSEPEPTVGGVLVVQGRSGWVLIDVEVPESQVARFSTKVREPEVSEIVLAEAERRMSLLIERGSESRRTSKAGTLTVATAVTRLAELIDELHAELWGETLSRAEASAALRDFVVTGKVVTVARPATGSDRQRLQTLVAALGYGEGKSITEVWPA